MPKHFKHSANNLMMKSLLSTHRLNEKKQLLVTLSTEAIGRNCWSGIAYSTITEGGSARQTDPLLATTQNFGNDYSMFEDRVALEIYKKWQDLI